MSDIESLSKEDRRFPPPAERRPEVEAGYRRWRAAVERSRGWAAL